MFHIVSVIGFLRKLIYLLALLCFVVLTVTGFFPRLVFGRTISSYWLMIHATAAPVFSVCVAALAVMWAHNCRFNKNYWLWLQKILQREAINKAPVERFELGQKICFWLIITVALSVILSAIMSMLPVFGAHGQHFLLDVHRYVALLLVVLVVIHTYLLIRTQMRS